MVFKSVETKNGKIKGYIEDGICTFKGIPYAKAKRFHQPEPVAAWEGELDATSYGYVCPLIRLPKPTGELMVPHRYWPMDEDCLNLNIWTPGCDDKKRPVIFWMHGGGFADGSSIEQVAYEGGNLSSKGDVVVVSINHRLNLLGFFDLSDYGEEYKNSGNAGLADIVEALKWVNVNIDSFGGDAGNVTIIGQSGGGAKVSALLQTPAADGLYAKGINMSGVIPNLLPDHTASAKPIAEALMKELKIDSIKELEEVPYTNLFAAYENIAPKLAQSGVDVGFSPLKNDYYLGEPNTNDFRKESSRIPLLVGSCFAEFTGFMPPMLDRKLSDEEGIKVLEQIIGEEALTEILPLFKQAYPERPVVDMILTDDLFRIGELEYVRKRAALNECTYSYIFNVDFPMEDGRPAWHCSDIPFVFHNTSLLTLTKDNEEMKKLDDIISSTIIKFAYTGNPNNEKIPQWPASTRDEEKSLIIGKKTEVRVNHDEKLIPLVNRFVGPAIQKIMQQNSDKVAH